ncbi:MAG: hypothetical protein DRI88_05520 [Bacteroidetes bacterium]|nr:MAG: hypothetical protein DRI88_05520 [Bacteroidota bacterium]RLD71050.1 MAG: hypothetical protein DRI87_07470 [Bacteroidota bacterium]RLD87971.1 MAG: hypothetical protein DRJ02_05095 [Bacteroidota bacterium]
MSQNYAEGNDNLPIIKKTGFTDNLPQFTDFFFTCPGLVFIFADDIKIIDMENRKHYNGLVAGLVIALIGTLLLLRNVGLLDYSVTHYIISWKTLLIALGLIAISRGKYTRGVLVGGLGVIFWLPEIFHHQFTLHQVLVPSLFVIIGITLLMKAGRWNQRKCTVGEYVPFEEIKSDESAGETA